MLSGKLLPAHPKPLPNEVLSSWFARVAKANAVKQHSLAFMRFEAKKPPWMWTLDLDGGEWFLRSLCESTGTNLAAGARTTLTDYSGVIYPERQRGARTLWILPIKAPNSTQLSDGIMFCPICLSEGLTPYFRRQWRLAFFTFCPIHMTMLYQACPSCNAPVAYHRHDYSIEIDNTISTCNRCGEDYRSLPTHHPDLSHPKVLAHYRDILIEFQANRLTRFDLPFFTVLHKLCMVMMSYRNRDRLREYVYLSSGIEPKKVEKCRLPFSWRGLATRHHIISLALWLMIDPVARITKAWESGAVRYASLTRDFKNAPQWYLSFSQKLNRQKTKHSWSCKKNFDGSS